ncbi:MAG TPA: (E)-4-hydroxy-3-methylbut-2-enyl-diphosphate synthase [Chlamydiales bacterium]|jgi:(E)-4-hydroxy-3-methylbut-2-enyl-diphosphate synthase|nr:(E)-4-hydroxy-3-methylbut-2-enyl-diphosphate synthase [Chlamydiales bacterium]
MKYCESIHRTRRWKTREVMVGNVGIGGVNPIRVQSMTTSDTRNVEATIEQILRLEQAGCEIARVTVQGKKEAESCEAIKNGLLKRGCAMPLVADIHFYPPAALLVAEFVDKVRINPGNFVDRRAAFKVIEYDELAYARELEKIEEGFSPLVLKCKRLKKAMRIGTNHGSLSDRIMNRFGDSPRGMVESALEFARVCRKYEYHDFVFSMKASHPIIMMQAYRLLVAEMMKQGWDYPLHLGVTEAGEGEDGRIKSAMGIGALLLDGLGDTIRVSLTEDPWAEIDPCKQLVSFAQKQEGRGIEPFEETHRTIEDIQRRRLRAFKPVAMAVVEREVPFEDLGWGKTDCFDLVLAKTALSDAWIEKAEGIQIVSRQRHPNILPLIQLGEEAPSGKFAVQVEEAGWEMLLGLTPEFILFSPSLSPVHETRKFIDFLAKNKIDAPVILHFQYEQEGEWLFQAGAEFGAALGDKLGEGIALEAAVSLTALRKIVFSFLQSARLKATKTDFISCPGCGRTLFELQEVSRRIREKTAHLPGVKIAIMGCIVNGPGEMADADFGYVGSKPGKIDLYVGKTCVEKDIDMADADKKLIELIAKHGKWVEIPIDFPVSI